MKNNEKYSFRLTVTSRLPTNLGHIPMSTTIDFAELIRDAQLPGVFDPNSVEVVDLQSGRIIPHARTEDFAYSDRGRIEWVIRERMMSYEALGSEKCKKFHSIWHPKLQYLILDVMRKDPIGAYVEIMREIRHAKTYMKKLTSRKDYDCFYNYRKNVLESIKAKLETTKLIQGVKDHVAGYKIGDRQMYREIFTPSVRPNFMLTRYIVTPPEEGKSVGVIVGVRLHRRFAAPRPAGEEVALEQP